MKISYKIFGSFLLTVLMIVFLTIVGLRFFIHRGFTDYVNKVETERLSDLLNVLKTEYQKHQGWERLRSNPRLLREKILSNLIYKERDTSRTPPGNRKMSGPKESAAFPGDRPPIPRRGRFPLKYRVFLLDEKKQPVVGRAVPVDEGALIAITVEEKTVGWLGREKRRPMKTPLEAAFLRKQYKLFYLIGAGIILITGLVAFLLSKHLLAPVKKLADGTQALAARDFKTRIHVTTKDELGQLASDFNVMASTLEKYEQMRKQWILDISHELRTPMSILRGEIEALQDGVRKISPQTLDSLYSEVLHLGKIVEDLHELSLADTHSLHLEKTPLDPILVLEDTLKLFETRFAEAEITVQDNLTAEQKITLPADADRLAQLYSNILENTLRYADKPGWLKIWKEQSSEHLVIYFQDSGPGVPDKSVARLFDRLFRVDSARNRAMGGSGLGLAICKAIVEAHGGEISADNVPGGGLEIQISLPIRSRIT